METIKVNMSPNPLDVQTIHASQNDSEAREWGFELHNNGEKIDSSSISDQLVFKSYKGGTEQILPENGAVPVTAPFVGDVKYPDATRNDQEFLYRESPTEEDGLAKITDIKGNTLVWNQLVQNGNFASSSGWGINGGTLAVANNIATLNANSSVAYVQIYRDGFKLNTSHRYLIKFNYNATNITNFLRAIVNSTDGNAYVQLGQNTSNSGTLNVIVTPTISATRLMFAFVTNGNASGSGTISNVQVFDLTQMGLDSITSVDEFTSLFSLPYYSYNQGSLLSFNGNGIKTVGKNLFKPKATFTSNGITFTNDNGVISINGTATANAYFVTNIGLHNGSYFIGVFNDEINNYIHVAVQNKRGAYPLDATLSSKNKTLSLNNDIDSFIIWINSGTTLNNFVLKPMISFEASENFEPYTSSTSSLPVSTYFPTGMKSAGSVYDELTPSKATTRIGAVDLGSLGWYYNISSSRFITTEQLADAKRVANNNEVPNMVCPLFEPVSLNVSADTSRNKTIAIGSSDGNLRVRDSSFTDATTFKSAMNGVYLYYELATPTETSFTTASLVTENAEIPLSNEDGVLIGKCTEQLSENPGFIDAKIKLSDSDGTCYSNKLQLHVERSPQ